MMWVVFAAAAQFSGPSLFETMSIFSPDDMPAYVQIAAVNRFILTRTTISPEGIPRRCVIERSGGDPKLDTLTCAIILKRARFHPATWTDGSPVHAISRVPINWVIGGASEAEIRRGHPPDAEVTVRQLPKGAKKRVDVRLLLAVSASGEVVGCREPPTEKGERRKTFPELVPVACQQMLSYPAIPAKDALGKPVQSVQNVFVTFSGDAQPSR